MKIGIMGGTFDPIHIGHLIAAEAAREACDLNEVWFIPTAYPPLKHKTPGVSADQRFQMTLAAIGSNSRFRAIDIELARGGVSYSYDTVKELQALYPGYSFSYIIGSDRINDLARWNRIRELAELVNFIGLERPSDDMQLESLPTFLKNRLHLVEMPPIGISSTELRDRLVSGRSVRYLVPESVYAYIRGHGLYGTSTND